MVQSEFGYIIAGISTAWFNDSAEPESSAYNNDERVGRCSRYTSSILPNDDNSQERGKDWGCTVSHMESFEGDCYD